jgi:hypothetical protein
MIDHKELEKFRLLKQLTAAIQEFESMWNSAVSTLEAADSARYDKAA